MLRYLRHVVAGLTLLVLVTSLLPSGLVLAGTDDLSEVEAVKVLQSYNIVRGDPSGNLGLEEKLTRAQAAALFIRVQGAEQYASALASVVPFTDAVGHWAAGEIAMADRLGLMHGDGQGIFRPDSQITYAEVLTVLLRILGKEPQGPWSRDVIMSQAARLSLVPGGVLATDTAVRRKIFWSLAEAVSTVPLPSGETALQRYFDRIPPEIRLDRASVTTAEETVTITGTATGASSVTVDGNKTGLDSGGRFSTTVRVPLGDSTIKVEAVDYAGNRSVETVSASRQSGVARLEITGPSVVRSNSSTKYVISAFDKQGNSVQATGLKAELTGDVATFSIDTGTLIAGSKPGRGVLTLSIGTTRKSFTFDVTSESDIAAGLAIAVNNGRAPSVGKDFTVKVTVVDTEGKLVQDDYWRTITLSASGLSGITISNRTVSTEAGVATFTVKGMSEGEGTLTANATGMDNVTVPVQVLSATRVVLTATTSPLQPDGISSSTIRAVLQDENGKTLPNSSSSDIRISVKATGVDGLVTDEGLTIRKGASTSSGDDGTFKVGIRSGTARIEGTMISSHSYSVQNLDLPVTGKLPGVKLQLVVPSTNQPPGQSLVPVTVKVLDNQNRVVTTGSYAFQITVATSNKESTSGGIPDGVEFSFSNSAYYPVDDGRSASDSENDTLSVIGRTSQGTASLSLKYDKSGVVTLTPKLVQGTEDAYHPTSGFGPAAASAGMEAAAAQVTFAGTPARIELTVDSALGKDMPGGATGTSVGSMTVRAQVVDTSGTLVPGYSGSVTLTRSSTGDRVTKLGGTTADYLRKSLVNNEAEWTVQTTGTPGHDIYTATASGLPSSSVTLAVRDSGAAPPSITAIRGSEHGDPSPDVGYIGPDADYMDIQINSQAPPDGGPTYWVAVKVYRKGESNPLYTGAVDLKQDPPIVHVPKANLRAGAYSYDLSLHNGVKDSGRSPDPGFGLDRAVNAVYNTAFKLNGGLFDSLTGKLTLTTSGLNTTGLVDVQKLSLVKDATRVNLSTVGTEVISISSSSVSLRSPGLIEALDPEVFYGAVKIEAESGWYTSSDLSSISQSSTTALLKPLATISHATLDEGTRTLYLYGEGFNQGTLSLGQVEIGSVALRPGSGTTYDSATSVTETQVIIRLSQMTLDAIRTLPAGDLNVSTAVGWLKVVSGSTTYQAAAVTGAHPVYVRVVVTSASYDRSHDLLTLRGSGFTGAQISPAKLSFRASGSHVERSLSGSGTATVVDSGTLTIQISTEDAAYFESSSGLSGKSVFLNTASGWLRDGVGRMAAPVPSDSVLFTVPAQ